jgi:hypothetical protein
MPDIISFQKAIKKTDGNDRALLLGNGFSIQYFSYKTLLEKAGLGEEKPLSVLFKTLKTYDFEVVMKALEDASVVETAYGDQGRSNTFKSDADRLRKALVHAVRETHPPHREDIQNGIPSCIQFLKQFNTVFTLNYDLLLYWVILEETRSFHDGFGLGEEKSGFRGPFKQEAACNIYNLHGGLHLFRTSTGEVEKRTRAPSGVIDAIAETILTEKRLPIYVAEGTSDAKLSKINSIPYLKHCYDTLRASRGSFFVYGSSARRASDEHIYRALFKSRIDHLYFSIHRPTDDKLNEFNGVLAYYAKSSGSRIGYTFVDAQTARVWDGQGDRG